MCAGKDQAWGLYDTHMCRYLETVVGTAEGFQSMRISSDFEFCKMKPSPVFSDQMPRH